MATRELAKTDLEPYFDRVSKTLGIQNVEIEVASLDLGDQIEAEWTGLTSLAYDPKSDTLDVVGPTLDHRIRAPKAVHVQEGDDGLHAVNVERGDGVMEIIRLSRPLALPAPAT
jgi:hypothetical protein